MADVMLALTPALVVGVVRFGMDALILTLVCMASAVAAEWVYSKLTRTRNTTVDGSALVTGLLLAMTLPHTCPIWRVPQAASSPSCLSSASAAAWARTSSTPPCLQEPSCC